MWEHHDYKMAKKYTCRSYFLVARQIKSAPDARQPQTLAILYTATLTQKVSTVVASEYRYVASRKHLVSSSIQTQSRLVRPVFWSRGRYNPRQKPESPRLCPTTLMYDCRNKGQHGRGGERGSSSSSFWPSPLILMTATLRSLLYRFRSAWVRCCFIWPGI